MEQVVSRSLYRAVLRFARHSNGVPFSLSASEARAAVPLLFDRGGGEDDESSSSRGLLPLPPREELAAAPWRGASAPPPPALADSVANALVTKTGKRRIVNASGAVGKIGRRGN